MTHSLWRSPVPYLMGGIGTMLVLIFFALFLLVCSDCSRKQENEHHGGEKDEMDKEERHGCGEMEERVIVIMAGHENPSFIAKPSSLEAPAH
ncbi:hypothetical protein SUGI_0895370 [Cryptomeria japonica]|nr:hypothetical protein SUGI_0895370 [Cryptomeria japonica]